MPKTVNTILDLVQDPRNARRHPDANRDVIRRSLNEVGAARSIVIDEDNQILAGNGVTEAAAEVGIENVIVVEADGKTLVAVRRTGLTPEQKTRLALYDNRAGELAEWNAETLVWLKENQPEMLDGMFDKLSWEKIIADLDRKTDGAAPDAKMDAAEELQQTWATEVGQLWVIPSLTYPEGAHKLMVGDTLAPETMPALMGNELAALMWTDPPYGVAYTGRTEDALTIQNDHAGGFDPAKLEEFLRTAFNGIENHLRMGASFYICYPSEPKQSFVYYKVLMEHDWILHQILLWVKEQVTMGHSDYQYQHEPILYGWKRGKARFFYAGRNLSTVFTINSAQANTHYPTIKPVELVETMLRNSSQPGDIVLDPFLGSGTTLVAAERMHLIGRGIELDPKYAAVTLQRMVDLGLTPYKP